MPKPAPWRLMMKRLFLILLLVFAQVGFAQKSKVAPDLPSASAQNMFQTVEVIVQFKASITNFANPLGAFNNNVNQVAPNGTVVTKLPQINAVHMKLPLFAVQFLQALPTVAYISPNRPLTRSLDITTQSVNANLAWNFGWDGSGVGVAVIDSGITPKHDLTGASGNSRVVYSQSFLSGVSDPTDGYGHG